MSWQAYVDTSLVGTGNIDQAAIFSAAGDSKWAASTGFTLSQNEIKEVVGAFKDTSTPKQVQSTGLHIAGQKYIVLKADDTSIYAKKGKTGVIIRRTKQALLIGHYPETVQPGSATTTVENLGDYLLGLGY